ncbi:hypothetical protein EJ07DRAFT_133618 [Lizonia empirigonia]|nr:hypothetical protein EJ07DRAFT_133618 [Lizonia empirigonia]
MILPTSADIRLERRRVIDPNAVTNTLCTAPGTAIDGHDINVALLSICGGIQAEIQQCRGSPSNTTGASQSALFTLTATTGVINISKGRWEGCVAAARATCGDSPFTSTCIGGANGNRDNVNFSLTEQ